RRRNRSLRGLLIGGGTGRADASGAGAADARGPGTHLPDWRVAPYRRPRRGARPYCGSAIPAGSGGWSGPGRKLRVALISPDRPVREMGARSEGRAAAVEKTPATYIATRSTS